MKENYRFVVDKSWEATVPWHEKHFKFLLLFPSVMLFILLTAYPLVHLMYTSLHRFDFIGGQFHFIGLANFFRLLGDERFINSIMNILRFMLMATFSQVLLGLGLAVLFDSMKFRGKILLLPILILPMMIPSMVVNGIWRIMYSYEFGVINRILEGIGFSRIGWLLDPAIAMESVVLVDIWQFTPFVFLVLFAGLQAIPEEVYEAAKLDGSTKLQTFTNVTLPLLKHHILLVILLRTVDTSNLFDKVFVLTGGGPGFTTETISLFIYRQSFVFLNLGYGAAASIVMLLLVILAGASLFAILILGARVIKSTFGRQSYA
ncbi:sugar ABC transporter permease [Dehalococcoidia bacterium]|nr:sugar ABC transporter permease [Dehalococcoidia bacterium]